MVQELQKISYLRDVQIGQSIRYPALNIEIDRIRAAQLGLDVQEVSRSLVASTSSSRYTEKNIWTDEKAGYSYSVQVQVPERELQSLNA